MPRLPTRHLSLCTLPALILLLGALASCGVGGGGADLRSSDAVALIVGEGVPESAAKALERGLGQEVRFSRPQPMLRVERIPLARFEEARTRTSLLLLINLNVPGKLARAAREILDEEQINNASAHHGSFMTLENVWARDQSVVVVASLDAEGILSLIEERAPRIRELVVSSARERLLESLFREGEDSEASRRLATAYGWSVRVPRSGWRVDDSHQQGGYVRIETAGGDRSLAVSWTPADSVTFSREDVLALREAIGTRFEGGVSVDRDRLEVSEEHFNGAAALFLRGAWSGGSPSSGGGAFQTIAFIDPKGSRLYLLDCRAGVSADDEKAAIWQLEALAATFRPEP